MEMTLLSESGLEPETSLFESGVAAILPRQHHSERQCSLPKVNLPVCIVTVSRLCQPEQVTVSSCKVYISCSMYRQQLERQNSLH